MDCPAVALVAFSASMRRLNAWTAKPSTLQVYSTALTIDSITFLASPNTIIVFGW